MTNKPALPPGFRFYPTVGEVIDFLLKKIQDPNYDSVAIAEVDLNTNEPSELPGKAKMGEKELYFYSQKGKKYPTGSRINRATRHGYWKITGKDKEIFKGKTLIGMKKNLVFYTGRAPRGEKTSWGMHEFRLEGDIYNNLPRGAKDSWVVCKVFDKNLRASAAHDSSESSSSTLQPLVDPQYMYKPTTSSQEFLIGAPASSSSIPHPNFSSMDMMTLENIQQGYSCGASLYPMDVNINQPMYYYQTPAAVVDQNCPYFGSENVDNMHQGQTIPTHTTALGSINSGGGASTTIRGPCKSEQLSPNSTISVPQDIGLSMDEIHDVLDCFTSDFVDNIWNY